MVALLVFTGIILTIVTGVIQIRKLFPAFRLVLLGARGKDHDEDEVGIYFFEGGDDLIVNMYD